MRLDRSFETAHSAILGAAGRIQTVNVNRYTAALGGIKLVGSFDIFDNSALVAMARFCEKKTHVEKMDFGFSLASPVPK